MKSALFAAFAASFVILAGSAPAHALEVGDAAPCVSLQDIHADGSTVEECIRTRDAGRTYVMLEFFATTCGACEENLPVLTQLADEISATTTTRMIGIDRDATAVPAYVQSKRDVIHVPVAIDSDRDATHAYGVDATPTVFILDATNHVVYKTVGTFDESDLPKIRALVAPH